MIGSLELGILGLRLTPEEDVCATCSSNMEQDAIPIPLLREGLLAGDKCVRIVDAADPSAVLGPVGHELDAHEALTGQRRRPRARPTPICDRRDSRDGPTAFVRVVGEMTWA